MTQPHPSEHAATVLVERDRALLAAIDDLPIVPQPWRELARMLGTDEADVLSRVQHWLTTGGIRCIVPMFNSRRLGYVSTLAASCVPVDRLDAVAKTIAASSTVSHNFLRDDPQFNLWFTVTAPRSVFDSTLAELAAATDQWIRRFDVAAHYKISFRSLFASPTVTTEMNASSQMSMIQVSSPPSREVLLKTIDVLQDGLPNVSAPFAQIANRVGASEAIVIDAVRHLKSIGVIRRLGALIDASVFLPQTNAMVVWQCEGDRIDEFGRYAASHAKISHCYRRHTFDDWLWSVYTVIHGCDRDDVHAIVRELSQGWRSMQHRILWTLKQFKQQPIRYDVSQIELSDA